MTRPFWFTVHERYTRENCLKVIKDFHKDYGKILTQKDIVRLSKKGKSPSITVFSKYGGLTHLINSTGLASRREIIYSSVHDEPIRPIIKKELQAFISAHGRIPTTKDFSSNNFSISLSRIQKEFRSLKNCLSFFGYSRMKLKGQVDT